MPTFDDQPASSPYKLLERTDTTRDIAFAVPLEHLGIGEGPPFWVVLHADKDTGNITCALRQTLPTIFTANYP